MCVQTVVHDDARVAVAGQSVSEEDAGARLTIRDESNEGPSSSLQLAREPERGLNREAVILSMLPQVHLIARYLHRRCPPTVEMDELISAGTIGLITALDRYDPKLKVKLETYVRPRIRGAMLDSLRSIDWAPRATRQMARKIERAICSLERRLKRKATEKEIAAESKLSIEEYRRWRVRMDTAELISLDASSPDEEGQVQTLRDFVPDRQQKSASEIFEQAETGRKLADTLKGMRSTQRLILEMYADEELSTAEIAGRMKIKPGRVSNIKWQAIMRLRADFGKTCRPASIIWPGS